MNKAFAFLLSVFWISYFFGHASDRAVLVHNNIQYIENSKFISLYFSANAQIIVNNNAINESSGKTKKIKFLATAHDKAGEFIFKSPKNITAIGDGSFFVIDDFKLLKFGQDGEFLKIVVRRGEGPAEATYLTQIFKRKNDMVINTGFMNKLMVFDFKGIYL